MKRVEIYFDESVENEIMMILRQAQVENWSRIDNVRGHGTSGSKLGNAVGPGINSVLVVFAEDESAGRVLEGVRRFKQVAADAGGHAGTKCAVMDVEAFV